MSSNPNIVAVWTHLDFAERRCSFADIGNVKDTTQGTSQEVQQLLEALPPLNMAEMRQAALRVARGTMGYDAFFLQYPAFHQKFVIAMVKESAPAPAAPTAPVLDIPWLTNNRFAYKRETPALELIDNAKIVEPPKG